MSRALISVSDKTAVIDFARALAARGYDIISTGGTARALQAADVPVTSVSDITGVPEMLDGRVKTLHPAVHGGILARRNRSDDLQALARHRIGLIDIVAVNLYPFVQAAATPATTFEALIEEIDIGGPSLVRAAAKNFSDVLVIVSPSDYGPALDELDRESGPRLAFRFDLARKAFAHTAAYDSAITATLANVRSDGNGFTRGGDSNSALPLQLIVDLTKKLKMTSVVVTHEMKSAFRIADRMIVLDQGRVVASGTAQEIQSSAHPYVRQFINGEIDDATDSREPAKARN